MTRSMCLCNWPTVLYRYMHAYASEFEMVIHPPTKTHTPVSSHPKSIDVGGTFIARRIKSGPANGRPMGLPGVANSDARVDEGSVMSLAG